MPEGAVAKDVEFRASAHGGDSVGPPVAGFETEGGHGRLGFIQHVPNRGAPDTGDDEPGARHDANQPAERELDRFEIAVDVGVVELDVLDQDDMGKIVQELGRLVEKRGVVFVALDDEVRAAPDPKAAGEILRDSPKHERRISPRRLEDPGEQRRRRGLSVGSGHDHRPVATNEQLFERLGQRRVAHTGVEHVFDLGIAARERVPDHDQIRGGVPDMRRVETGENLDPQPFEERGHRRIDSVVGSGDLVACGFEHPGQGGHRRAADAGEKDPANGRRRQHARITAL
jgi:hypothetical protein